MFILLLEPLPISRGRVLGYRLGGENREFPGVVGTSIVKVMDYEMGKKTGISEREARENSLLYKAITAEAPSHASYYYPGAEKDCNKTCLSS